MKCNNNNRCSIGPNVSVPVELMVLGLMDLHRANLYALLGRRVGSTPISTTSRQASRQRDAPTLNPAETARASLESAIVYCSARRGRGERRRGRQEALIAQSFTCVGIQGLSCALWKVAGSAIVGCAAAALPGLRCFDARTIPYAFRVLLV